jgi:hypothetical protein
MLTTSEAAAEARIVSDFYSKLSLKTVQNSSTFPEVSTAFIIMQTEPQRLMALVGSHIMYKWPREEWCQGEVIEGNDNPQCKTRE